MNAAIAERELGCGSDVAYLRFFAPQPDRNSWRCDIEIAWPSAPRRSYAIGVDSFQALQLAMLKAAIDVAASDDFKAGRLSGFGKPLNSVDQLKEFLGMPSIPGFDS